MAFGEVVCKPENEGDHGNPDNADRQRTAVDLMPDKAGNNIDQPGYRTEKENEYDCFSGVHSTPDKQKQFVEKASDCAEDGGQKRKKRIHSFPFLAAHYAHIY